MASVAPLWHLNASIPNMSRVCRCVRYVTYIGHSLILMCHHPFQPLLFTSITVLCHYYAITMPLLCHYYSLFQPLIHWTFGLSNRGLWWSASPPRFGASASSSPGIARPVRSSSQQFLRNPEESWRCCLDVVYMLLLSQCCPLCLDFPWNIVECRFLNRSRCSWGEAFGTSVGLSSLAAGFDTALISREAGSNSEDRAKTSEESTKRSVSLRPAMIHITSYHKSSAKCPSVWCAVCADVKPCTDSENPKYSDVLLNLNAVAECLGCFRSAVWMDAWFSCTATGHRRGDAELTPTVLPSEIPIWAHMIHIPVSNLKQSRVAVRLQYIQYIVFVLLCFSEIC